MESLPTSGYIKFHPDTLSYIRREYNLDKPGEMDRAIDSLEEWLKKQNHFTVINFPRDFLERQIILDKGSVERAKKQLDNLFTMKTISTSFIGKYDAKNDFPDLRDIFIQAMLPKLTKDHYRVYAAKVLRDGVNTDLFHKAYGFGCIEFEYIRAYDYCNGFHAILDYRDVNIMDLVAALNLTELKQFIGYIMDGYQMRLRGLHILTKSKTIDVLVSILRQMFSKKIGQRIHVHTTEESLHMHIEKEILPREFGGEEKSLASLCDEMTDEMSTPENIRYFKEMGKAVVDESLRVGDKISKDDILGISGSFRTITVD